ncbi:MAG: corrinoid protein [Bacillota bacterium]
MSAKKDDEKQIFTQIVAAVVEGEEQKVELAVSKALEGGTDPFAIVEFGISAGMKEVGERFDRKEFFLPELICAAASVKSSLELLRPRLAVEHQAGKAKIVFGTVAGDFHDIGKNLVIASLEGCGHTVEDLGIDVTPGSFVEAARSLNAHIVACSALLTTTMVNIKDVIDAFKAAGMRDNVKILIGGASINEDFCRSVGADYYGENVQAAVAIVNKIMEEVIR